MGFSSRRARNESAARAALPKGKEQDRFAFWGEDEFISSGPMRKTAGLSHIESDTAKRNKSSRAGVSKILDSSSICNPCRNNGRGYFLETDNGSPNFSRRYYETMRRAAALSSLGRMAVKASHYEELKNYEERQYDEMTSGLAEALKGSLNTHYTFELRGGRLTAKDGELIGRMLQRGVDEADQLAQSDAFYAQFLPQRSRHEMSELLEQEAMARGETEFNTMVTFSAYGEEYQPLLNESKLKRAGQKPQWQRAMLRLSHWDGQNLHIFTRSIDNSSLNLLQETAQRSLGYEFRADNSTSMLGERIKLNIGDKSWQDLPDVIVNHADAILAERLGGKWVQGRSEAEAQDLQAYVLSQTEVVAELINLGRQLALEHTDFESYQASFNSKVYDYVSLLQERLKKGVTEPIVNIQAASAASGALARAEGISYDMCGLIISPDNNQASLGEQTGFESLGRLEGKKISCPECKNKVVVPKKDLEAGKLTCSDCGYGVDVCTGKTFRQSKPRNQSPPQPDLFDKLSQDLKMYAKQIRLKQALARPKEGLRGQGPAHS